MNLSKRLLLQDTLPAASSRGCPPPLARTPHFGAPLGPGQLPQAPAPHGDHLVAHLDGIVVIVVVGLAEVLVEGAEHQPVHAGGVGKGRGLT